jgi:hypothetical protein
MKGSRVLDGARGRKSLGHVGTTRGPLCGQAPSLRSRHGTGRPATSASGIPKSRCPGRPVTRLPRSRRHGCCFSHQLKNRQFIFFHELLFIDLVTVRFQAAHELPWFAVALCAMAAGHELSL